MKRKGGEIYIHFKKEKIYEPLVLNWYPWEEINNFIVDHFWFEKIRYSLVFMCPVINSIGRWRSVESRVAFWRSGVAVVVGVCGWYVAGHLFCFWLYWQWSSVAAKARLWLPSFLGVVLSVATSWGAIIYSCWWQLEVDSLFWKYVKQCASVVHY